MTELGSSKAVQDAAVILVIDHDGTVKLHKNRMGISKEEIMKQLDIAEFKFV